MPTKTLGKANIKYQNITIPRADQHLLRALPHTINIVDVRGGRICAATKHAASSTGDIRLACPHLFRRPLPGSVCSSKHMLAVGDVVDWDVQQNVVRLKSVSPGMPVTAGAARGIVSPAPHAAPVRNDDLPGDPTAIVPTPANAIATNFCIQLVNMRYSPVHTLKKGTQLVKGGQKKNTALCQSCKAIAHKCLCYYWKCGDAVFYVGSATPYKQHQTSSLLGRVLNYLQNHTSNKNGDAQVNKRVFTGVNRLLATADVEFGFFEFDFLTIRDHTLTFQKCTDNPKAVEMVEYMLIHHYKLLKQASWNK